MAMTDETESQPLSLRTILIAGGVLALFMLVFVIFLVRLLIGWWNDAPVRDFKAATADMNMEKIADMKPEERKEFFENMKNMREKMNESQKQQVDEMNRERFQAQMTEKMNKFFALTPAEQKAALDKDLDRMAGMMKMWSGNKAPDGKGGPGAGGSGAGGPASGGNAAQGSGNGGAGSATSGNAPAGGAGGPPGGGGPPWARGPANATPEQRNKRMSDMLDKSTPEFRAQMTEYRKMMEKRAIERGIQAIPFIGGAGGGAKGK